MPNVGPMEIAIVLIIALVIFGPKRLPELGKSMGHGIREFKDSLSGEGDDSDEKATLQAASQRPQPPVEAEVVNEKKD